MKGGEGDSAIEDSPSLLERLAAGDRLALARVTRMATACLRRLGAYDLGDECQDLCQEVVWALVRAVRERRAPDEGKTHAYVASVVRNHFVSWLRRRGTQPRTQTAGTAAGVREFENLTDASHEAGVSGDGYSGNSSIASLAGSSSPSSVERMEARRALAKLPREWQSLLIAHYVEGCTIDMLVQTNGMPRATLNREIRRAREAFRAYLLEDGARPATSPATPVGSALDRRQRFAPEKATPGSASSSRATDEDESR